MWETPIQKPLIVFYKEASEVQGLGGRFLSPWMHSSIGDTILDIFNRKRVPLLLVSIRHCTGWRTKLTEDEVVVLFTGEFEPEQIAQAKARVAPKVGESNVDIQTSTS